MATNFKTPGVYIQEINKFPPSVAQVATAIPAFVGYTEKAEIRQVDVKLKPIRISSQIDYESIFGQGPDPIEVEIELNEDNSVKKAFVNANYLLYDSIRMFYANGGGDCYVVSVGGYDDSINKEDLIDGLNTLEKEDEPTLLVIPEAVKTDDPGSLYNKMLAQCNKLQNRFAILDIKNGDTEISPISNPVAAFRDDVGLSNLKYGATYYPWLNTSLSFKVDYESVIEGKYYDDSGDTIDEITEFFNSNLVESIKNIDSDIAKTESLESPNRKNDADGLETYINELYQYFKEFYQLEFEDKESDERDSSEKVYQKIIKKDGDFHALLLEFFEYNHYLEATDEDNSDDYKTWVSFEKDDFEPLKILSPEEIKAIRLSSSSANEAYPYFRALTKKLEDLVQNFASELKELKEDQVDILEQIDPIYSGIIEAVRNENIVLPPSGAIAGVYASVDNDRGVWKSPANVSLSSVHGPAVNISNEEQEDLNIPNDGNGKSINAIRAFTGKGTLVWGARTLAGNDNEWRYISVRRFFIMVEDSVKKASAQFVFEPNDANTWVKVRAMIENFLTLQWRAGALAGAKPEHAFYVRVGLGQTMTSQDILEGYMNIEIGMAVVRPAEFIILKFSHKMQES